jgi:hypothetical protein
MDMLMLRAEPT